MKKNVFLRKKAFTLAEVLIVVGIIGIIAAMTLPALMLHFKHKVLQTQFEKAYSDITQALQDMPLNLGVCKAQNSGDVWNFIRGKFSSRIQNYHSDFGGYEFRTYNFQKTTAKIHPNCLGGGHEGRVLYTASYSIAFCTNDTYNNMLSVDTNGPLKGPNAYGHDLFFFHILPNCTLEPMTRQWRNCSADDSDCSHTEHPQYGGFGWKWTDGNCSKDSKAVDNGFACTSYAIKDKCPDGSSKGYFDCLP